MQLIVLPRKRQTRQERHGKLVIIVIIITIIIISLGSSRYPSTGSDASYVWVETVKREEATCTECKIQKGFWGGGHTFNFFLSTPPSHSFFCPFCSIFFSSHKNMFPLLALSQSFSHFCHTITDGDFHLFRFPPACPLWCIYNSFPIRPPSYRHIHTHTPCSPRHATSPHCYETATSLHITFPTSCGMHIFPFLETKEWHLSLSQKRPLAIPPPLCKFWTPTKSLSTFSRSWHLLLSPLGKYGTAKNNFPLICLVIMDPSYLAHPTACSSAQRLSQCINPSESSGNWMLPFSSFCNLLLE